MNERSPDDSRNSRRTVEALEEVRLPPVRLLLDEEAKSAICVDIDFAGLSLDRSGHDKALSDGTVKEGSGKEAKDRKTHALSFPSPRRPATGPEVAISMVAPLARCCGVALRSCATTEGKLGAHSNLDSLGEPNLGNLNKLVDGDSSTPRREDICDSQD